MRCRISGSSGAHEIPLLVMLFYLFRDVLSRAFAGSGSGLKLSPRGGELRGRQRQVGSLAGAAHLLKNNTGVLRSAQ